MTHDQEKFAALRDQRIAVLKQEIDVRETELNALEAERREANSPFKVGDVICWNRGKEQSTGRVIDIGTWVCGDPAWKIVRIRRDGTDGCIQWVYPYNKPVKSNAKMT